MDVAQPGALPGSVDDVADAAGGQLAMRCVDADEDAAALRRGGASASQVGRDRRADAGGERQALATVPLPHDPELTDVPVDVVQAQTGHLSRPEAQTAQQEHDRVVTAPRRPAPVTRAEQCAQL